MLLKVSGRSKVEPLWINHEKWKLKCCIFPGFCSYFYRHSNQFVATPFYTQKGVFDSVLNISVTSTTKVDVLSMRMWAVLPRTLTQSHFQNGRCSWYALVSTTQKWCTEGQTPERVAYDAYETKVSEDIAACCIWAYVTIDHIRKYPLGSF